MGPQQSLVGLGQARKVSCTKMASEEHRWDCLSEVELVEFEFGYFLDYGSLTEFRTQQMIGLGADSDFEKMT